MCPQVEIHSNYDALGDQIGEIKVAGEPKDNAISSSSMTSKTEDFVWPVLIDAGEAEIIEGAEEPKAKKKSSKTRASTSKRPKIKASVKKREGKWPPTMPGFNWKKSSSGYSLFKYFGQKPSSNGETQIADIKYYQHFTEKVLRETFGMPN